MIGIRSQTASSMIALALTLVFATTRPGWRVQAQAADQSQGDAIYKEKCARCHGDAGDGNGPAASLQSPRPRDFRQGFYKIRTTETGSLPTDDDLKGVIRRGMPGSAMPAWEGLLSEAEIDAVVGKVKSFSSRFASEQSRPAVLATDVPVTPESIAAGKEAYERLACSGCHGTDGAGADAVAREFEDDWGHPTDAANLTEPWTFGGGATARDIYTRLRTGLNGTPMPSYASSASDNDLWNVATYVVTLARKPLWDMTADEVKTFYAARDAANRQDPVARGKYLVHTRGCVDCHSPIRADGSIIEALTLAGGQRWQAVPYGDFYTTNLTSDESGVGGRTDEQLIQAITRGIRADGSRMLPFPMPWTAEANLSPDDAKAIVAYLRTVPPIDNRIPKHEAPNIAAYMWGKFRWLILGYEPPALVYPGNAGSAEVTEARREARASLALAMSAHAEKGAAR